MKRIVLLFTISCAVHLSAYGQVPDPQSSTSNCQEFEKVMSDAYSFFYGYEGDQTIIYTIWGEKKVLKYKLGLWGSTRGILEDHALGIGRIITLEYYYGDSKSTATALLNDLVSKIEKCLPSDMYLEEREEDNGDITYRYKNVKDKEAFIASYPMIQVLFKDYNNGKYAIEIKFYSMNAGRD